MVTTMLMMIVGMLALAIVPWIAQVNRYDFHRTDLMAGDEGDD
jgi:hypothetical protein